MRAVDMAIALIGIDEETAKNCQSVHSIPARVEIESGVVQASVQKYLETQIQDTNGQLTASFRGRRLNGRPIEFPRGYKGFVVDEVRKPLTEDAPRKFRVSSSFSKVTYWNWDRNVSENDSVKRIDDWIEIAEALHSSDDK